MRTSVLGVAILALYGCASGGGGGEGAIPVYRTPAEVPCAYEVIDTVRAGASVSVGPSALSELGRTRDRALGRAGAGVGADAVIQILSEQPPQRRAVPRGQAAPVPMTFEGEAVRYLDPSCPAAQATPSASAASSPSAPGQCRNFSQVGFSDRMSPDEVEYVQRSLSAMGAGSADLLPISGDRVQLQNQGEMAEFLRRGYPPLLRDAGITGTVRVLLLVDESGKVHVLQLAESSGHRALDQAASTIALRAEFNPLLWEETPICHWLSFPISFARR